MRDEGISRTENIHPEAFYYICTIQDHRSNTTATTFEGPTVIKKNLVFHRSFIF